MSHLWNQSITLGTLWGTNSQQRPVYSVVLGRLAAITLIAIVAMLSVAALGFLVALTIQYPAFLVVVAVTVLVIVMPRRRRFEREYPPSDEPGAGSRVPREPRTPLFSGSNYEELP